MDLETKLLRALADYHPELAVLAKVRAFTHAKSVNPGTHKTVDGLVGRYLLEQIEVVVPAEEGRDEEAFALCERREEVIKRLADNGLISLTVQEGLLDVICAWAAAQAFTSWQGLPWKRLADIVLDEIPEIAP